MKPAAVVTVDTIRKSYALDGVVTPVLEDISFSLGEGEVLVLLGASGSGKSTLLRLLAGVEAFESGTLFSKVARPGPSLSYLPQGENLLPWRTVRENVRLSYTLRRRGRQSELLREMDSLIAEVGMKQYASSFPAALSGGMVQRVLLARALAANPRLLLLDEPFSQLDLVARRDLSLVLRNHVRRSRAATILVTHSLEETLAVADRIIVLSRAPARVCRSFRLREDTENSDDTELTRSGGFAVLKRAVLQAVGEDYQYA